MEHTLPQLPYALDALAPHVSHFIHISERPECRFSAAGSRYMVMNLCLLRPLIIKTSFYAASKYHLTQSRLHVSI